MPYMIYQQITTAIKEAYADDPKLTEQLEAARACREWLQSLQIDPGLRGPLAEPIEAIERALADLLRAAN